MMYCWCVGLAALLRLLIRTVMGCEGLGRAEQEKIGIY